MTVSDFHCNSTVGLCPPRINLDDGGTYRANRGQQWLWNNYLDFIEQVKLARKPKTRTKLYLVLVGDLVEGDHHGTTQLISHNMADQHKIALATLEPLLGLKPDYLFIVRGTEAHVGKSAQWEEMLAKDLDAVPDDVTGTSSWWHLPLEVEKVLFDIAHHGTMGRLPWTRQGLAERFAVQLAYRKLKRGHRLPDIAVRAHRHYPMLAGENGPVRLIALPSWQLSTAFGHKIDPGGILPVGGAWIKCKDGEYSETLKTYDPPERMPWRA